MVKVILHFAGTGGTAKQEMERYETNIFPNEGDKYAYDDDVIRIYFNGCQDAKIGGKAAGLGYIDPNLDVVAEKIASAIGDKKLSLNALMNEFGDSLIYKGRYSHDELQQEEIESFDCIGFSRGALAALATARELDGVGVPISLLLQEPVPGNLKTTKQSAHSEYTKNSDLSRLNNLAKVDVILGLYRKESGVLKNNFFRQMIPKFSKTTEVNIRLVPKKEHVEFNPFVENEILSFLNPFITNSTYPEKTDKSKLPYSYNESKSSLYFIPKILQQRFHHGAEAYIPLSQRYKSQLHEAIRENNQELGSTLADSVPVKKVQALYALLNAGVNITEYSRIYV